MYILHKKISMPQAMLAMAMTLLICAPNLSSISLWSEHYMCWSWEKHKFRPIFIRTWIRPLYFGQFISGYLTQAFSNISSIFFRIGLRHIRIFLQMGIRHLTWNSRVLDANGRKFNLDGSEAEARWDHLSYTNSAFPRFARSLAESVMNTMFLSYLIWCWCVLEHSRDRFRHKWLPV